MFFPDAPQCPQRAAKGYCTCVIVLGKTGHCGRGLWSSLYPGLWGLGLAGCMSRGSRVGSSRVKGSRVGKVC
jgi:hypothetical protein